MKKIIFLLVVIFAWNIKAGSKIIVDFDGRNAEGYKLYFNSGSEKKSLSPALAELRSEHETVKLNWWGDKDTA